MIGKVQRGKRINGLVRYLFGPGECNEHVNPHVVAGFRPPAALEPALRPDGTRDVGRLNMLLNQPLALIPGEEQHERPVRHIVLRAAPEDPVLSDDDWAEIAHEVMDATGRAPYGDDLAVRWVAVRHAADHVHITFNLARQDGGRPPAWDDYRALRQACRRIEDQYGLRSTAPADGTVAKRATRAEHERAERSGRSEPVRVTLRRAVQHAAAAAHSEQDFFDRLHADGVHVRLRYSSISPGQVTGYAVAVPGYVNKTGQPVWFGGGKLAADLTLPKLRHRWTTPSTTEPVTAQRKAQRKPCETGFRDTGSRVTQLRETVADAAATARSEGEFFAALAERGLRIRLRHSQQRPDQVTGYSVSGPTAGDTRRAPLWISGGHLGPDLSLPRLRRRWAIGEPGVLTFAQRDQIWRTVGDAARRATADIQVATWRNPQMAADTAAAAADVLNTAARRLGTDGRTGGRNVAAVRQAAEAYDRAARDLHGRTVAPTPAGTGLRAVARLLADHTGEEREHTQAILTMLDQIAGLADAVAQLRATQHRHAQAAAARRAAEFLHAPALGLDVVTRRSKTQASTDERDAVRVALLDFPHPPIPTNPGQPPTTAAEPKPTPSPAQRPRGRHR